MAEGWTQLAGGRYYLPGGTLATGWQDIDGKRYHFSSDGLMSIGFVKLESNRYYFDEDGAMVTGAAVIEDRRYLFIRRYWYADSISQIAGRMNMSVNQVSVILSRLRHRLKDDLIERGFDI